MKRVGTNHCQERSGRFRFPLRPVGASARRLSFLAFPRKASARGLLRQMVGTCLLMVSLAQAQESTPPVLPTVARPPAQQPAVGLATDTHLDKTPPRQTQRLDLVRMGWTYNCMECHKLLKPRWHYDRPLNEHKDIRLEHGNNRFCLNCHHPTNRNAFVDYDGSEIKESDVVLLCAKCHGPTYRDWQAGVHGRQNGYWNKAMGDSTKLRCIQCHDPHQPAFHSMKPLPPLRYPARAAGGSARTPSSTPEAHHD